jgi:hypothetical protein
MALGGAQVAEGRGGLDLEPELPAPDEGGPMGALADADDVGKAHIGLGPGGGGSGNGFGHDNLGMKKVGGKSS